MRVTTFESPIPAYVEHLPLLPREPPPAGLVQRFREDSDARVRAAIGQASALARGAGVQVGRLLSMSTESQGPQPYFDRAAAAAPAPGGADSTPTAPGLISLTATVTMTFAMS